MGDAFAQIVATLDAPMVVVTAADEVERSGCLVGFQTQCSIDPRRWLVCISKRNHTLRVALAAQFLAVHILREDQRDIAELFGEETDDAVDKFARCGWKRGPHDVPVIDGCDCLIGRVTARHDFGDHVGHVLDVTEAVSAHPGDAQLGFQSVRGLRPGHPP